jgi:hypothetical protein
LSGGKENIEGRERRRSSNAIPEVYRKAGIPRPERIAQLAVAGGIRVHLPDPVHGERARARKLLLVPRAREELQEGIAVAAGAIPL